MLFQEDLHILLLENVKEADVLKYIEQIGRHDWDLETLEVGIVGLDLEHVVESPDSAETD